MLTVYITKYELAWWLCFGIWVEGHEFKPW